MNFFLLLWVIFALLDPVPDSEYGSGSTDPIEYGSGSGSTTLGNSRTFKSFFWQVKQEDKAHAQEKFVEIQQAYEKLSDIKSRRARANKISEKMPADTQQKKTEL
jgi:hypothetical protein